MGLGVTLVLDLHVPMLSIVVGVAVLPLDVLPGIPERPISCKLVPVLIYVVDERFNGRAEAGEYSPVIRPVPLSLGGPLWVILPLCANAIGLDTLAFTSGGDLV